jgi:thiamine biosynthesis protein ThiS
LSGLRGKPGGLMMAKTISITFNGFKESVPQGSTVASLLEHFEEMDSHVIVELNGKFIFEQKYAETLVSAGDDLEFINPNFGG